ncbi:MAG: hypothetical protein C4308_02260 [Chitinophagaceae bacterium]
MKNIYSWIIKILVLLTMTIACNTSWSQSCPNGFISTQAFDTTVYTGSGNYSTDFVFPKFSPDSGVLRCVRMCITITGRVTMALENNVNSAATYNILYYRNDTLTGPGLTPPLTSNITVNYGPYLLAASDGVSFSGPDFITIGPDTVLNQSTTCRTITDSTSLIQFYGVDSLVYHYTINAGAVVTGSGDYLFSVSTQGEVSYHLEYCYCPSFTLPLSVFEFNVVKKSKDEAELNWKSFNDPVNNFSFEPEVSRDGLHFKKLGTIDKKTGLASYNYRYKKGNETNGRFYFRIKQVYANSYTRFSEIKYVDLESAMISKLIFYPNPSSGVVGIKFADISSGKFLVEIFTAQGQTVLRKEIEAYGNEYRQITSLQSGNYWVRLTDVTGHLSCVNQLLIK